MTDSPQTPGTPEEPGTPQPGTPGPATADPRLGIPPAPGSDWTFNPPPGWPAPTGFDPRKGHPIDPTWPAAPAGWLFWSPPAVPKSARENPFKRIGVLRLVIGLAVIGFLIFRFTGGGSPSTGVGSCWKPSSSGSSSGSGVSYQPTKCSDSKAEVRVVSQTGDPSTCANPELGYLDSTKSGDKRYQCLAAVSH